MAEATGDDERFGSLYDAHRAALAAYCRRRVADDVLGQTGRSYVAEGRSGTHNTRPDQPTPHLEDTARTALRAVPHIRRLVTLFGHHGLVRPGFDGDLVVM